MVEHLVYTERVIGSSPLPPTIKFNNCGGVAQLVRAPACHAGGREFKSRLSRHFQRKPLSIWERFFVFRFSAASVVSDAIFTNSIWAR